MEEWEELGVDEGAGGVGVGEEGPDVGGCVGVCHADYALNVCRCVSGRWKVRSWRSDERGERTIWKLIHFKDWRTETLVLICA